MQGIPEQIKLFNFAKRELSFEQIYQVGDFPRLSDVLSNPGDKVAVKLSFYLEEGKIPCVSGVIELEAALSCQRCLEAFKLKLKPEFKLAFVTNEQQGQDLDADHEISLLEEDELSTIELITDEILLSIPMIPMHEHECLEYQDDENLDVEKPENPFAILKTLKTKH